MGFIKPLMQLRNLVVNYNLLFLQDLICITENKEVQICEFKVNFPNYSFKTSKHLFQIFSDELAQGSLPKAMVLIFSRSSK